jgi:SH3 domain protein
MSDVIRFVLLGTALTLSLPAAALQQTATVPAATTTTAPAPVQNPTATPSVTTTAEKAVVQEKPAFIIDTLSTPLRSGPGNEYRTISSVRAGENVTYIGQNPANGFIKVRDADGAEGWLSGEYITYSASPKASTESLKQQLRQQEMIVAQFEQEREQLQQALSAAEAARDQAVQESELAKQTTTVLTRQLAAENPPLAKNKMIIGGGILAAGLLLGLLLPVLMPKRRRNDRWM